ncbi:MAG TPA: chorismate synthase [Clostridia bacterium]|nr:chorismate synthase [Clostridia bacterium]
MSSSFGKLLTVTIFGQSHSEAIGVVLDGLPAGVRLDMEAIHRFMGRRAPGANRFSTARSEEDIPQILSGLVDGVTCGAPLCATIKNGDARSKDYDKLRDLPRPMHADYAAAIKYGGANDIRGGGQFSGRLTAPLCFAGAVAIQLLAPKGITVGAHIAAIAGQADTLFDPVAVSAQQLTGLSEKAFPVISDEAGLKMQAQIDAARAAGDSVGGIIECAAVGVSAGLGEPLYEGLENRLATAVFGIPAVKGLEFGAGFAASAMRGSAHNDPFMMKDGQVMTETNNHGGILGGISTGMPITLRAAFKPTPSIAKTQQTVSLSAGDNAELAITGRHDPCVVPRAVPCVEAAVALVLLDLLIEEKGRNQWI